MPFTTTSTGKKRITPIKVEDYVPLNVNSKPASPTLPTPEASVEATAYVPLHADNQASSSGSMRRAKQPVQPYAPYKIPDRSEESTSFKPFTSALGSLGLANDVQPIKRKRNQLCSAESNGGRCNDKTCPFMHFSDFVK